MYVVWFNMLFGDSRDRWDGDGLTDPRVRHYWDEQKVVGNWFSANVTRNPGTTWDFYAIYAPDATWDTQPPKALSQGGSIIGRHAQLQSAITALLHARG